MKYCSLEEAFDTPFVNDEIKEENEDKPEYVYGYEKKDGDKDFSGYYEVDEQCGNIRDHCVTCPECLLFFNKRYRYLRENRLVEGFKETGKNNIIILLLVLLLVWMMTKK